MRTSRYGTDMYQTIKDSLLSDITLLKLAGKISLNHKAINLRHYPYRQASYIDDLHEQKLNVNNALAVIRNNKYCLHD